MWHTSSPVPLDLWPCRSPRGWTRACCWSQVELLGGGWTSILAGLTADFDCGDRSNIDLHCSSMTEQAPANIWSLGIEFSANREMCVMFRSSVCGLEWGTSTSSRLSWISTDRREPDWECAFHHGSPDVEISQHLQIDDGFGDALDAVVVKV